MTLVTLAALLATGAYLGPRLRTETMEPGATAAGATKIAVLPFANLSSDPEQRPFVDGLTDELIVGLQRLPGMKVTGRTTSFTLRDSKRSAKQIAADLGVQYVLEGSVDSDGQRLRVRAQLSDASGISVLPYRHEGAVANLFNVQDEFVGAIAAAGRAPLGPEQAVDRAGTGAMEAYQLYLAAKLECALGNLTIEGFARALGRLDQALQIDPRYARAWMLKSQIHSMRAGYLADGSAAEIAAAEDAATHAIGLAPEKGDGYNARALLLAARGDWLGAMRDYDHAHASGVSEFPHDVVFVLSSGRIAKARDRIEELLEVDPLNEDLLAFLAVAHELLGDRKAADDVIRRGRLLHDTWLFGDAVSTWIRLGRGRVEPRDDAIAAPPPFAAFAERIGDRDAARTLLAQAADEPQNQAAMTLANLAIWAAYFGDSELAIDLLSRAVNRSALLTYVAWLPVFDDVRQRPAFKSLLLDVGLVDYWRATGWPDVCRAAGTGGFDCSGARPEGLVLKNSG
jgi:TolB-like protein/Tfp pilus assembly protein PilF